ncbi:MAG: hypothetical protein K6G63_00455, partial [Eubacterium sp.]|nr:hypothetical protein [Eubacterium sp.]
MIRFIKQKLIHKKWMVICLLIGNILLAAIASSNPMYKNAALEKTLNSKFEKAMEETKEVPGVLSMEAELRVGKGSSDYYKSIEELAKGAPEELGITPKYMVRTSKTVKIRGEYVEARGMKQSTKTMRLASMTELDKHIKMVAGQKFDGKKLADGSIPVILSQKAMTKLDVILNDKIKISKFNNSDGSPMVVTIVGVFDASDYNDNYWVKSPSEYYTEMFVDQSLFDQLYVNLDNPTFDITSSWDMIFDHTSIKPQNVDYIIEKTEDLIVEAGRNARVTAVREARYLNILREYQTTAKKVYTTLLILQIPVLSLLLAFIFMISRQMLDLEQNEIALLKSRGSSRMQIIFIYFLQSAILSISSCIVGIPLAFILTKILGSTNGFLEFIQRRALNVTITGEVFLYALGAIIVSILVMVLPV